MKDTSGDFFALLFQMKNIVRWGLMYNTQQENLSEHAAECAILAHALALIGNDRFGKHFDPLRLLGAGLYHDMNEVLTGDLPTPVKYYNEDIRRSYKEIEAVSEEKMLSLLAPSLQKEYRALLDLTPEEKKIVKGADKLCAYIKCLLELERGNKEFAVACRVNERSLKAFGSEEVDYFMEHMLSSFIKNIDEVSL